MARDPIERWSKAHGMRPVPLSPGLQQSLEVRIMQRRVLSCGIGLSLVLGIAAVAGAGEHDALVDQRGVFDTTQVRADAQLDRFAAVELAPIEFRYRDVEAARTVVSQSQMLGGASQGPFPMDEELRDRFESIVTDALMDALERSDRFQLVDASGPETLLVRATVSDVTSNLPPLVAGAYDVYLSHAGTAKVLFEVVDAGTDQLLARFAEERRIQPPSRMNEVGTTPATIASVSNDMRIWAADVAGDLMRAMARLETSAR
jgi:hypothetical protein